MGIHYTHIKHPAAILWYQEISVSLQWRHNVRDGVWNHQPLDCLLNCLFRCRSKKTPKLRATGLCEGNSPVTGEFPTKRDSDTENISIWWRHHGTHITRHKGVYHVPISAFFKLCLLISIKSCKKDPVFNNQDHIFVGEFREIKVDYNQMVWFSWNKVLHEKVTEQWNTMGYLIKLIS